MVPYWLMFLIPAIAALSSDRGDWSQNDDGYGHKLTWGWVAISILLALVVGYRYEVGGDWFTYVGYLYYVTDADLTEVISLSDPGYMLLNWLAVEMGWGIVGVNALSGFIFSLGIVQFCRSLPRPWLALAVAVPYLVIVVGMGYSRQGIALSLALLGVLAFQRGSVLSFFVWVALGATFHKTAVLLLPLAALVSSNHRWWTIFWALIFSVLAYFLFLEDSVDHLYENYLVAQYQSQGALIRLLMNAIPAVLLLWFSERFRLRPTEASMWRWFALISIFLFIALFISSSSTAVDRVALYMLPLQMMVFSHLPSVLAPNNRRMQTNIVWIILFYYLSVLNVWLLFADHSQFWIPYRFYPLEVLF